MEHAPVTRSYPLPPNEQERLVALYAYDILDTLPEPSFDKIVATACRLFNLPISLISLVDDRRQWFKAKRGLDVQETDRGLSFCTHAILEETPLVVCDATKDVRFQDSPLVTGDMAIRFYVGAPIKTKDGLALGSLCVIDTVPHEYPEQHLLDSLADLAFLVVEQLEFRAAAAARLRADNLRRQAEERYVRLVETASDIVLILDDEGTVVEANHALQLILGYEPVELIGNSVTVAIPEFLRGSGVVECQGRHKSGFAVPLHVSYSGFDQGQRYLTAIIRDVTEVQRNVEALRASEAKLSEAQELAHLGYWERDLQTNVMTWSDEAYRIMGLPVQSDLSFEQFQTMLPADDRQAVLATVAKALETGAPAPVTHRLTRGDGALIHVESRGRLERDAAGKNIRLLGTMMDVTEKVKADRLRQNINEELGRLVAQRTELLDRSNAALRTEIEKHKRTQEIISGQNRILQEIAAGAPLEQIFDELLCFGESGSSGNFVGLLFLKNEDGRSLRLAAAPQVPSDLREALSSADIGLGGSPAGAAAYRGERVLQILENLVEWPLAKHFQLAGIRWMAAAPIVAKDKSVLGAISFAIREGPTDFQLRLLDACVSLAKVALQRDEEHNSLRLSERTLREVQRRVQIGLDFAQVAVWTWDVTGEKVDWSGAVAQVFGRSAAQLNSYAAFREMILPEDRDSVDRQLFRSVREGRDFAAEFRVLDAERGITWIAAKGGVTLGADGQVVQMSGVNYVITERKRAERELADSEMHFRELAESMPQIVWTANAAGDFEYCNRRWYELTGLRNGNPSHEAWLDVLHPDDVVLWRQAQVGVHEGGRRWEMELRIWDEAQQRYRWYLAKKEPILGADGKVLRCYGTCTDIHDRKMEELKLIESERALRKREEQMSMLFDTGAIGDFVWDLQTDLVTAHPTVWKLFGKGDGCGAAPSTWFTGRYHPLDAETTLQSLASAANGESPLDIEYRVLWPDGTVRWLASFGVTICDAQGKPVQMHGLGIDITERKTAELRIQESERQLREQADAMPLIVWRSKADGEIDYCNHRWEEFSGFSMEQTKKVGWQSIVHVDDLPRCLEQAALGFSNRQPFILEFRAKRAADGRYRWLMAQCFPTFDSAGSILRWFGAGIDIDDQKTENERLEVQVVNRTSELNESLKEKETLLREVHHRVKNNLQVVSSLLRMQEQSMTDERASSALRDSRQRVITMALIHERLYGGQKFDEVDFVEYAMALVDELFASFAARAAHVVRRFNMSPVRLNINQAIPCGLILNELITNALKYAYPSGTNGEILVELAETAAGQVRLSVADNGQGLPEDFHWNDSQSMGLPIAELLATQIGGLLSFRSRPGTTFTVEFPREMKIAKAVTAA